MVVSRRSHPRRHRVCSRRRRDACALRRASVSWNADGSAGGRGPIDPRTYVKPVSQWARRLDGRFVALRYARETGLEVVTDPTGSYPVYEIRVGSGRWVSNRPALLAALSPRREIDAVAVAQFLA